MLSLCVIAILAQQAGAAPNASRQGPLLVAEEVFTASVMSVEDGDSVVVKMENEQIALNLAGVDAPELSQPNGLQARQFLSDLTLGKTVTVRLTGGTDRMARLEVAGVDVTEALVRGGMGWHCPRYADDRELTRAEAEARSAKRGLWSVAQPTPPWLHRGAGACWQQSSKPRVSSENRPNFSGTWTAVSPPHRAGQQLKISRTP
jgi:micrococcal nuclease